MPMFRDCTWVPKYALRKAVNQVNGAQKDTRNGHNTGFLGTARSGSDGLGLPFGGTIPDGCRHTGAFLGVAESVVRINPPNTVGPLVQVGRGPGPAGSGGRLDFEYGAALGCGDSCPFG